MSEPGKPEERTWFTVHCPMCGWTDAGAMFRDEHSALDAADLHYDQPGECNRPAMTVTEHTERLA